MALGARSRNRPRRWPWSRRASGGPAASADPAVEAATPAHDAMPPLDPRTALRLRAEASVVDLDDALRASVDELAWARRQLGDTTATSFDPALTGAGAALAGAMTALDAARAVPDTEEEAELLTATLAECRTGAHLLDEAVPELDALRDLRHAVAALRPELVPELARADARATEASGRVTALGDRWPPGGLAGAQLHLHRAHQGLAFAGACMAVLERGPTATVAAHGAGLVRLVEASLTQVDRLLDQVERAPGALELAERASDALLAQARVDRAEAERLGVEPGRTWHFADDTVEWALGEISSQQFDPVTMRRALEESESALHAALTEVRTPDAARRRAEALLPTAAETAGALLHAAEVLVRTRCGAVGVEARIRLAEAHRLFEAGRRLEDPEAGLDLLQRADRLAEQAATLAQQDEASHRDSRRREMAGWDSARETAILLGALVPLGASGWAAVRFGGPGTRTRLHCVLPSDLAPA